MKPLSGTDPHCRRNGARGARLTGAGFGGCAIALVPESRSEEVKQACKQSFAEADFGEPAFYEFVPAAGAELARTPGT